MLTSSRGGASPDLRSGETVVRGAVAHTSFTAALDGGFASVLLSPSGIRVSELVATADVVGQRGQAPAV